jgi:hypothetical protein
MPTPFAKPLNLRFDNYIGKLRQDLSAAQKRMGADKGAGHGFTHVRVGRLRRQLVAAISKLLQN